VGGVVACEVRVGVCVTQVVDSDDRNFAGALRLVEGAQNIPADSAVTIDGNFDGHPNDSLIISR
jgi:hypothetical protein